MAALTYTSPTVGNLNSTEEPLVVTALDAIKNYPFDNGTYTPTLTNTTNVAASTASADTMYSRVGAIVTVGGMVNIDPTTASTNGELRISLPITSSFSASYQLAGVAAVVNNPGTATASINSLSGGSLARLQFNLASVAAQDWVFSFVYRII